MEKDKNVATKTIHQILDSWESKFPFYPIIILTVISALAFHYNDFQMFMAGVAGYIVAMEIDCAMYRIMYKHQRVIFMNHLMRADKITTMLKSLSTRRADAERGKDGKG